MSVEKKLSDLAAEYEEAKAAYDDAERAVAIARNRECDCLNRLNAAQKAWDEHISLMRQQAPLHSDWKQRNYPPSEATVSETDDPR